jgi:hypothetical protein
VPTHNDRQAAYAAEAQPCRCLQSWAYISPWHPGHCCFVPASQTCHAEEVAAWEQERMRRRVGPMRCEASRG